MSYLYETHMHTSQVSKCGRNTGAEQIRAYIARGYAGVIVTDHFVNGWCHCPTYLPWEQKVEFFIQGYEDAKKEGDKYGFDVFFGWEYPDNGSDFLTYGLDIEFLLANPMERDMRIEEYSAFIRKHGGFITQAHPYRILEPAPNRLPVAPHLINAVEVFNTSQPPENNARAYEYAKLHNLPMQSGSDSHGVDLSFPSGVRLNKKADSIWDIINGIKTGQAELICR